MKFLMFSSFHLLFAFLRVEEYGKLIVLKRGIKVLKMGKKYEDEDFHLAIEEMLGLVT